MLIKLLSQQISSLKQTEGCSGMLTIRASPEQLHSKVLLLPFPSQKADWQQALLSQLSCVAKSLPQVS